MSKEKKDELVYLTYTHFVMINGMCRQFRYFFEEIEEVIEKLDKHVELAKVSSNDYIVGNMIQKYSSYLYFKGLSYELEKIFERVKEIFKYKKDEYNKMKDEYIKTMEENLKIVGEPANREVDKVVLIMFKEKLNIDN